MMRTAPHARRKKAARTAVLSSCCLLLVAMLVALFVTKFIHDKRVRHRPPKLARP
jgi:hypothetical protein